MITAKVSANGQVNIPKAVREALGVLPGDRIGFDLTAQSVHLVAVPSMTPSQLRGAFQSALAQPSLDALRQTRQRELADAYRESLREDS